MEVAALLLAVAAILICCAAVLQIRALAAQWSQRAYDQGFDEGASSVVAGIRAGEVSDDGS